MGHLLLKSLPSISTMDIQSQNILSLLDFSETRPSQWYISQPQRALGLTGRSGLRSPPLLAVVPLVLIYKAPNCKFGDIQELCYGPFIFMSSFLPIERTGKPCGSLLRSPGSLHQCHAPAARLSRSHCLRTGVSLPAETPVAPAM